MISNGHYASNHGGLVIYLHNKWDYVLKACNTVSNLWKRQIVESMTLPLLLNALLLLATYVDLLTTLVIILILS